MWYGTLRENIDIGKWHFAGVVCRRGICGFMVHRVLRVVCGMGYGVVVCGMWYVVLPLE